MMDHKTVGVQIAKQSVNQKTKSEVREGSQLDLILFFFPGRDEREKQMERS